MEKIMNILKTITFGTKYFETALRHAELINGILTNSEVWYGIRRAQLAELEEVDRLLLRRILNAPISSSVESLYLELGLIPLHIIIKSRRVKYLHYLLKLKESEMLYKVFQAQWKYPVRDDWTNTVKQDLEDIGIKLSLEEMKGKSEWSFRGLLRIKTKEYVFSYLLNLKQKHSKMDNLYYCELKNQNYLKNEKISVKEAQNLCGYRSRVAKFKENFRNNYDEIVCPLCSEHTDTQAYSAVYSADNKRKCEYERKLQ